MLSSRGCKAHSGAQWGHIGRLEQTAKRELVDESPSRRRMYITDADGIFWEFVRYLSGDVVARNDYSI
jgi:hypothetical protein